MKKDVLKINELVGIALSRYSKYLGITFDDWVKIKQEARTNGTELNIRIQRLMR